MEPTEITAGRLHLRPWQASDEDAVYTACQDPDIQRWTTVPSPYTREDARRWVSSGAPDQWRAGTATPFAVVDATTGELLASVGLHLIRGDRCEVGYWCAPWARGQSVISDAVSVVSRWGFAELGMQRIEWVAAVGNWPSRAVAQKCGFTIEGLARMGMHYRGGHIDAWVGALLTTDEVNDLRPLPKPPSLTDGVVSLRGWTLADAPDVARACDDAESARWLPMPSPYTLADAEEWLSTTVAGGWATGSSATMAATDATTGEVLGCINLILKNRKQGRAEIGYWTAPWGRGRAVASRGAALLAGWGLNELGLHRVGLLADVDNLASQRAAEKAGFTREGIARSARLDREGAPRDFVQFSLTRSG
jgi:RimJ/RimL family protein N-acetyltransferase